MLVLSFQGWFQARFAQDPDSPEDPRGVSGPTFVVPGEPVFDRIIRLNDFVSPRYPRLATDGVRVTAVAIDNVQQNAHPLLGARVDLLDCPIFHQRNFIVVKLNFQSPIDPFHLRIAAQGITIQRKDLIDPAHPTYTFKDVFMNDQLVARRGNQIAIQSLVVAEATGFMNYAEVRAQRLAELQQLLAKTIDPTQRAALEKRILSIENDEYFTGEKLAARQFLGMQATYGFSINGPYVIDDPGGQLKGKVGTSQDWPISFWMGGYDVDTLFGYIQGTLSVPFFTSS